MTNKIIKEIYSQKEELLFKHLRIAGDFTEFFTPNSFPLQIGHVVKQNLSLVKKHKHDLNREKINFTSEVLIIIKGELSYSIWDFDTPFEKLCSGTAVDGDLLILGRVAHSFICRKEVRLIEVKQGPYLKKTESE